MPLWILALLWLAQPTLAQAEGLYEQAVVVPDDSEQSLVQGRRDAMAAVLVKVSGSTAAASSSTLREALDRAADYASRHGFRRAGPDGAQLQLWAAFDPPAIDALLAAAGLPQWRGDRPETLVWLVTGPSVAGPSMDPADNDEVLQALKARADARGLALVVPLFDLQDQRALSAEQLWAGDGDAVRAASARYRPGLVLVGRLTPGVDRWSGQWTLYQGDERRDWQNSAADGAALAEAAMDWQADGLAALYAAPGAGGGSSGERLSVGGLRNFGDFLRVTDYLARSSQVNAVRLTRIHQDVAEFSLDLSGSPAALRRLLSLEGVLAAVPAGLGTAPGPAGGAGHPGGSAAGDSVDYRLMR